MTAPTSPLESEAARCIVVERTLDAPRELVFEAFTDTRHLSRWYGPDGFSITTESFEFRQGGKWRFVMHGPDGRDYRNRLTFDVIDPPSRLVASHDGGDDTDPANHVMHITLEAEGAKTRLTWKLVFASIAERDRVAREFHAVEGCQQTTARLVGYVASMAG
jgi:uncharacterized protein YndB with AHSA1/START domain